MSEKLIVEQEQHVARLTLNMPHTANALSDADFCDEISKRFEQINQDLSIRCVILTGAGKTFCSGGNLKHIKAKASIFGGDALTVASQYRNSVQKLARTVWNCEVPIIAAVNGPAYGAGCDLSLMADIRIAAPTACFAENFLQVGLVPGDGGSWLLPRQVGLSRAAEMTFTADPVDAATALRWGLVSSVVPANKLLSAAGAMAARVVRHPPRQLRLAKRLLREGLNSRFESTLELAAIYQGAAHQTKDHTEAVDALLEGRSASFRGD